MTKYSILAATVLLLACFAYGETGSASFMSITDQGLFRETYTGEYTPAAEPFPMYDPPEVLWHYTTQETGGYHETAPIGYEAGYVFTGGYYTGVKMFGGATGDGSVLWQLQSAGNWAETATAAAETADIFYAVFNSGGVSTINCFTGESANPVWTYDATGTFDLFWVDYPYKTACSKDGSVFAVGGQMENHLAIQFFGPSDTYPFTIYEDEILVNKACWVRVTADGSKCIFRTVDTLYRVDTATGTLEASCALDEGGSFDCFGVSLDGSVVAYGLTAARVLVWDGSAYNLEAEVPVPGYRGSSATVALDNSTVYFGFTKNGFIGNKIIRYDLDTSTTVWTYDYPEGSGGYQDQIMWMDCSDDGRWMVAGSWGLEEGGGDEVHVFDDLNPEAPLFSINTPGSIFHVDMTSDGRYVSAAGKHVHANEWGAGTDVYLAEVDVMGLEGKVEAPSQFLVYPNPSSGSFTVSFTVAEPCAASIELFDLSGRLVHSSSSSITSQGTASMNVSTDLPAGIYTCRLNSGSEENTTKLVITR